MMDDDYDFGWDEDDEEEDEEEGRPDQLGSASTEDYEI